MKVKKILETCLYSKNLDDAQKFYGDLLGLKLHSRSGERHLFFQCGDSMVMIFNPEETGQPGQAVPFHGSRGPGHIAFSVPENDLPDWYKYLTEKGVTIEADIIWPEGGRSLYFRDESNNSVELASPRIWGLGNQ
ncbi:MAG: VOC family protein [bacterium]|nr:MAG: VOC family protein [bacterium]